MDGQARLIAQRRRGYCEAMDKIANFLNALDTEGLTSLEVKKLVYKETSK